MGDGHTSAPRRSPQTNPRAMVLASNEPADWVRLVQNTQVKLSYTCSGTRVTGFFTDLQPAGSLQQHSYAAIYIQPAQGRTFR